MILSLLTVPLLVFLLIEDVQKIDEVRKKNVTLVVCHLIVLNSIRMGKSADENIYFSGTCFAAI